MWATILEFVASRMKYSAGKVRANVSSLSFASFRLGACVTHSGLPSPSSLKMSKPRLYSLPGSPNIRLWRRKQKSSSERWQTLPFRSSRGWVWPADLFRLEQWQDQTCDQKFIPLVFL
jgi:hypothetical protein